MIQTGRAIKVQRAGNVVGNVADSNVVTYWESTSNTNEWIKWTNPNYATKGMTGYSFKCQVSTDAPATWELHGSHDDVTYDTLMWEYQTTWTSGTEYYFGLDSREKYQYYKMVLLTANGGSTFKIHEMGTFIPANTAKDVSWEAEDATYQVGSSTAEAVTLRYYPGFRYVKAAVSADGFFYPRLAGHAHRPVCTLDTNKWWADVSGCTLTASTENGVNTKDRAVDGNVATAWIANDVAPPHWWACEFPTWIELSGIRIKSKGQESPKDFLIQVENLDGTFTTLKTVLGETDWTASSPLVTHDYTFDNPGFGAKYRIYVTATNGTNYTGLYEVEFKYRFAYGFTLEQTEIRSHTITASGQKLSFRCYEDVSDFPLRSLVMFRGDEYYAGVKGSLSDADQTGFSREGQMFTGWIDERQTQITRTSDGRIAYVDFTALDLGEWLRVLPGLPGVMQRLVDDTTSFGAGSAYTQITNFEIPYLNMDRAIWYLLSMDGCVIELGDYYNAGLFEKYAFPINQAQGGNIYALADGRAQTIAHRLTCNKMGQLRLLPDPMLLDLADRTTEVQAVLGPEDIQSISWSTFEYSRIGRHWGDGMQRNHEGPVGDKAIDPLNLTGLVCVAPAVEIWGQGAGELDQGEQLVVDQTELNTREGHRYAARSNPNTSFVEVKLVHQGDNGIDPARMSWVEMSLAAQYQRIKNVSSANLIGLWWINELGGTAIDDASSTGSDGTAANVTLNAVTGVDYEPAPLFNGSTSNIDVHSAGLATAFDEDTGTLGAWIKFDEDALTDSTTRMIAVFYADANNYVALYGTTTDNQIGFSYRAGSTSKGDVGTINDTDWHYFEMTWDTGEDEVKGYLDGEQIGSTQSSLGTWSGSLANSLIGSYVGSTFYWKGSIALVNLLDTPLTLAQTATLAKQDAIQGPDGETFAGERFLVAEKNVTYDHEKMSREVSLKLEREAIGLPAKTNTRPS
jgi:hypothetical protein